MKIPVLYYHKIDNPEKNAVLKGLYVTPSQFEMQMKILKFLGFSTITPDDLLFFLKGHKMQVRKPVVITFDDGYENNYIHAFPILKSYGFTATVFISTRFIGRKNAVLEEKGKESWPEDFLGEKEILELSDYGITIGSHGLNHYFLDELEKNVVAKELIASKAYLEGFLKKNVCFFSYPYGRYNANVMEAVKNAGYKGAFTTGRGKVAAYDNAFELKRIPVNGYNTVFNFLYKIIFLQ